MFYDELTTVQFPGFGDCGVTRLDAVELNEAVAFVSGFWVACESNRLDIVAKQLRNRVFGCLEGHVGDKHGH